MCGFASRPLHGFSSDVGDRPQTAAAHNSKQAAGVANLKDRAADHSSRDMATLHKCFGSGVKIEDTPRSHVGIESACMPVLVDQTLDAQ